MDWDQLLPILVDKVAIGLLLLLVGLWINRKLSRYRSDLEERLDTKSRIAEARLPAYRKLWESTSPACPERAGSLALKDRKALISLLRQWYYDDGQGIFLGEHSSLLYLDALRTLESKEISPKIESQITEAFATLRVILKKEIGIYGRPVGLYRYRLVQTYTIRIDIDIKADICTNFIELTREGVLTIRQGYEWNGAAGPTVDTESLMRASLVHDALYQLMRNSMINTANREYVDNLFKKIAQEDGVSRLRSWLLHYAIRKFGLGAASPESRKRRQPSAGFRYEALAHPDELDTNSPLIRG